MKGPLIKADSTIPLTINVQAFNLGVKEPEGVSNIEEVKENIREIASIEMNILNGEGIEADNNRGADSLCQFEGSNGKYVLNNIPNIELQKLKISKKDGKLIDSCQFNIDPARMFDT